MAQPTQQAVIEAVRPLGAKVRELTLRPKEFPLQFRPGQWVSLKLPVGRRPPLVRPYSMALPDRQDGRLTLCLDHVPGGLGSSYLFTLGPGDEVALSGPVGTFVLPDAPEAALVFVARFTGIVPIRCMLLALLESGFSRDILLIYGAECSEDLVYGDELTALSARHPSFHYVPTLLAPEPGWTGEVGAEAELVRRLVPRGTGYLPYVCGLSEMITPVRAVFQEHGFDRRQVRCEKYH
ncbi:MAG: hypothetical protein HYY85_17200 [Deltaproteobacteria bacterium]|nr:hypothetical protein [Deltaproteobacteria bacterium]